MNRDILRLAIPNIISNITVPLLGLVDMAIVGHLDSENYIGGIAIATTVFNFIYWNFAFLRMGTSGFTAQAYGAENQQEQANILLRSLTVAAVSAVAIVALQYFILRFGFFILDAGEEVKEYAQLYFRIYIWAAPAILGMYAFNGWFVGMQDAKTPMFIAIGINVINIALSLFFVYVLGMKIEGIALASVCAQYSGLIAAASTCLVKYKALRAFIDLKVLKQITGYKAFFKVNTDIFIRTLALVAVTTFFVSVSTKQGDDILAVNALLMQLFILFSYFMDGFAYAAEALTGKFVGAKKKEVLGLLARQLFKWGAVIVVVFSIAYGAFFDQILALLTDKEAIRTMAKDYQIWIVLIPICGVSAFLWDGIFIGATASKQMRNSMLVAAGTFFGMYYLLSSHLSNNFLWIMFLSYLAMRGIIQFFLYPSVYRKL